MILLPQISNRKEGNPAPAVEAFDWSKMTRINYSWSGSTVLNLLLVFSLCRCAFVSNLSESSTTPSLLPTTKEMQGVMERDLAMNVSRDGVWGAFRHQLIPQSI